MALHVAPVGKDTPIRRQTPSCSVGSARRTVGIPLVCLVAGLLWGCSGQPPPTPVARQTPPIRVAGQSADAVPVRIVTSPPAAETPIHVVAEPGQLPPKAPPAGTSKHPAENQEEDALLQGELLLSQGMIREAWQQWSPVAQGSDTPTGTAHADTAWRLLFESYFKQGDRDNTPRFLQEIAPIEPTANQSRLLQTVLNQQSPERLRALLQVQPANSALTPLLQQAMSNQSTMFRQEGVVPPPAIPVAPAVGAALPATKPETVGPPPELRKPETTPSVPGSVTGTPTKVGLLLPLSGKWTNMGEHLRRAAKKALADYPTVPIQLLIADSGDTAETSQKGMQELMAQQVDMVIGPVFYATVAPAAEVAMAHHVPIVTLNPQRESDQPLPGVFSNAFQPEQEAKIMARYAVAEKKYARIAILAPESEYGRGVAKTFGDEVQALGGTLVRTAYFPPETTDFSPWLKTLGNQFDALFLPAPAKQVRSIAPQAAYIRTGNTPVALLGTALWNSPELLTEGTDFLEGATFCDTDTVAREQFRQSFRQVWEEDPSTLATLAYDGVAVVAQLLQEQRPGEKEWRNALTRPAGFRGASGILRFLDNGRSRRVYHLFQVTNGQSKMLGPVPDSLGIP
ncbi:MAG: penicillin-binding protein activator [Magnetococcales bacterium]|nr:penicillin-binding protein activator [Magnetococcales bacterium]